MRRNMELVRKVLINIAESENDSFNGPFVIEGFEKELIEYHLHILKDAELIKGNIAYAGDEIIFVSLNLSWKGNEFLDTIENDTVWNKAKALAKEKGMDLTYQSFDVVMEIAKVQMKRYFGLDS